MATRIDASNVRTVDIDASNVSESLIVRLHDASREASNVIQEWIDAIDASIERERTWNEIRAYVSDHHAIIESHRARPTIARIRNVSPYGRSHGTYRNITRTVLTSPALIGNRTDGGERRHKRNADNVQAHVAYVAHRLSDMTVRNDIDGTSATIATSGRFPLMRNADGTVNATASLRLASLAGVKLASNGKR